MALADDITAALEAGAQAGAKSASSALRYLEGDVQCFVVPGLGKIADQVAAIVGQFKANTLTPEVAKQQLNASSDAIEGAVATATKLNDEEAKIIQKSVKDALAAAIEKAAGQALL
jgi:hypothetical protein